MMELQVVSCLDKRVLNAIDICLIDTEINSIYDIIEEVLVLALFDSQEFVPLFGLTFLESFNLSGT